MAGAERQLINESRGSHVRVIDGARSFLQEILVRIAHPDQVVEFLAERVIHHEREAMRESVGKRYLERVVSRIADVQPGIGDAAVLREGLQRLGDRSRKVRERDGDIGEQGLSLRQGSGRTASALSRDPSGRYRAGIWFVKGPATPAPGSQWPALAL